MKAGGALSAEAAAKVSLARIYQVRVSSLDTRTSKPPPGLSTNPKVIGATKALVETVDETGKFPGEDTPGTVETLSAGR